MQLTVTDTERLKVKVRKMAAGVPYRLVFPQLSLYLLVETGDRR